MAVNLPVVTTEDSDQLPAGPTLSLSPMQYPQHLSSCSETARYHHYQLRLPYSFQVVACDDAMDNFSQPASFEVDLRDFAIDLLPRELCLNVTKGSLPAEALLDFSLFEGATRKDCTLASCAKDWSSIAHTSGLSGFSRF